MSPQVAGILLSPDVFQTAWFQCLAAFVAFNTLIYVGLTLAKLIPWPRVMRPVEVRGWLERTFRRPAPVRRPDATAVPAARKEGPGTVSHRVPTPDETAQPTAVAGSARDREPSSAVRPQREG